MDENTYEVVVVGGGLAGLTAAIALAQKGISVLVVEKKPYPRHKVCGEYVSNEILPYLEYLGLDVMALGATSINSFSISALNGKKLAARLPLGGFGISRFALDKALYELALSSGAQVVIDTVTRVDFEQKGFMVKTRDNQYRCSITLGAFGKRTSLDKKLNRAFVGRRSPWMGVKCHYHYPAFNSNEVALHCFPGGYGGLSMVENGRVNFCYLAHYKTFSERSGIQDFNKNVVSQNPHLNTFLQGAETVFESPLSIAQISFEKKELVQNHILMCGDSAGLIHPLCGNGMAMAVHAAKIASDVAITYLNEDSYSRTQMELDFKKQWNIHFARRLWYGRRIQNLITQTTLMQSLFHLAPKSEIFLGSLIKQTHGKPILV